MEYVSGESLKTTIKRIGALPAEKVRTLAGQICRGLAEAHRVGIIHRDLKPQNIMIDGEGNAHIMDFGIARFSKDPGITGTNAVIGTPHYMSPEQASGEAIDPRSDIYSLGVILYEMLTGSLPFTGTSPVNVILKHKTEPVPDPHELNPSIPGALRTIVLKCLAKNPEDRYQDVDGLLAEFEALSGGMTMENEGKTRSPGDGPVAARRRRLPMWSAAVILSLPVLALLLWMVFGRKPATGDEDSAQTVHLPAWKHAVAVLPFKNLSADPEQDYFCDGMTEQLISNIAHIKELRVPARTTVMAYKNVAKDIKQISKELGVSHIVEGSVSRSGDRIRITASLIDVATGSPLWSKNYDRTMDDVFAIQDEVSQAIATALQLELSTETLSRIKTPQPSSVEAYDLYLEARHSIRSRFMRTHTEEDFQAALDMAMDAVRIDPDYAMGYVTLAYLYEVKMITLEEEGDRDKQRYYLEKAYSLDPDLAVVNSGLGYSNLRDGDVETAFRFIKRGLEINPNQFDVCHLTAVFLHRVGLDRQALDFYTRALAIDQSAFFSYGNRGIIHLFLGDLPEAEADLEKSLEIQPDMPLYQKALALVHILKGEFAPADRLLKQARVDQSDVPLDRWYRAVWFAARGDKDAALEVQKNAAVCALSGMADEAVELMPGEQEEYWWMYSYPALLGSPIYENLRGNPRFEAFVEQQKLRHDARLKKYSLDVLD